MPAKVAISWDWATNWLKAKLQPYLKDYADDPEELKNITIEVIEDEVMKLYRMDFPEKKQHLTSLKELYESLQAASDEDWNELLNYIIPPQSTSEQPSFEQIMKSIEPRQPMSMEDVSKPVERPIEQEIAKPTRRPIEQIMIKHPKSQMEFPAGPGKKVYNRDKGETGIIETIYEDAVVVKDEETGQTKEWSLTDDIWESK